MANWQLNRQAEIRALTLINKGDFTDAAGWTFTAEDSNEILGDSNFTVYKMWFLGIDPTMPKDDKSSYAFPIGKKNLVYLSALRAIRVRASQTGAQDIFAAAGRLLDRANFKMKEKATASANNVREISFHAPMTIEAAGSANDGKPRVRRFDMVGYTGGAMKLKGWSNPVVVDLAGVSGADKSRPVFLNHDENQIVGHADQITVDPAEGIHATGLISGGSDAAKQVLCAHDSGFPWQASIGARPDQVQFVERGQSAIVNGKTFNGPVNIARKTTLGEISFVPIGADESTSVRIAATYNQHRNIKMETLLENEQLDDSAAIERQRASEIAKAVSRYPGIDAAKASDIQAKAITEGWTPDKTELELIRAARPSPSIGAGQRMDIPDPTRAIEAGMCLNLGLKEKFLAQYYDARTMDLASTKDFRNIGLHSLLRMTIRAAGRPVPERIDDDAIRSCFEADRWIRAQGGTGSGSTMSLSNVVANVQNKLVLDTFNSVGTSWQLFCQPNSNKDFKPGLRIRLVGSGKFQPVADAGEIKAMTLQDQGFNTQIDTEGCLIVVGRKMIINDDQGALTSTPKIIGRAAAIALEKSVYTLLLSNPGSPAFFSADNLNLSTGDGSALSVDGLTAAEQLFLKQLDPNGDPALITPTVLIVPPELNVVANQLTRSAEIRDTTASTKYPTTNPHSGRFTVGTSPWLSTTTISGNSTTGWYLFGDPGDIAAMEVTYLNGQSSPTIQTGEPDFNTLGLAFRAFFDFGVSMLDPRGAVLSAGT